MRLCLVVPDDYAGMNLDSYADTVQDHLHAVEEKMNAALNLHVQTFAANSVINLNCSMEKTHKMNFETELKNYSEMNKRLENLDKVGELNPLFEFLFKNKCKNTK